MAANIDPIFPITPRSAWATITTANTAKDGTGTVSTVVTAGANGAFVEDIRAKPLGTNTASVLRVFLNNGSTNTVAANNSLWYEISLPASTLSEVASMNDVVIPINRAIPGGYKLNVTIGTTVAAGWQVTGASGDY
jgi:hypothetical protein